MKNFIRNDGVISDELEKRNKPIDIARGLAMIMVVLGHVAWEQASIISYVKLFHMALFFLVSGYLWKPDNILKTTKRYYIAYVISGGVGLLLHNAAQWFRSFFAEAVFYKLSDLPLNFLRILLFNCDIGGMGQLWFLYANLCIYILYSIQRKFVKQGTIILLSSLIAIVNAIVGTLNIMWGNCYILNILMSCMIYFALGQYIYEIRQYFCLFNQKLSLIIAILFMALSIIIWRRYPIGVDIRSNEVPCFGKNLFIFYILSIGCILSIFRIARFIADIPVVSSVLQWVGMNTLSILCLHVYIGYVIRCILTLIGIDTGSIFGAVILVAFSTVLPIVLRNIAFTEQKHKSTFSC